jgi:hypothetical protein
VAAAAGGTFVMAHSDQTLAGFISRQAFSALFFSDVCVAFFEINLLTRLLTASLLSNDPSGALFSVHVYLLMSVEQA